MLSSHGGLEVEGLLHKLHDSASARRQKDCRSNSYTTGGALVNNVQKINEIEFAGLMRAL